MSQLLQFYKSFQQARMPVAKAAPTFEDLTIDDKLTEHQRLVKYAKSSIGLQRLVHVKMISDVAQSVGFYDTVETIVPLLEPLSKDNEPVVRQHLVEQLRFLAKFCCTEGGEDGYRVTRDKLLPITAFLLEDEKQEVRQSASMTLVEIASLIRADDLGQYVLTIILRLAHEDDKEDMRMTAAQLLNLLAESLGQDLCRQFVIPEVVSLAEDPVFRVRKSTALNFHSICKVGGEHELLERLMPAFVRLSKDDMYRVRRACAESLSEISKNVDEDIRLGVLVEIFLRLTYDPSKLVKQTILQQSGMFIATLPSRAVSEAILQQYISMANAPTGDAAADAELKHICAYSFPAVLQVIGKNRWKEVRELYHNLAQTRSPNIKQTLAYSLHEIARILEDGQLVEEELVPVFEDFIQDVEAVQMGVIKYLAGFLSMLPELCRVSYLPILHEILHSTNPFNWRLRQSLAIQLPQLVALPAKPDVYRTLFPTVMTLLQDPVASVRRETYKGVAAFINAINDVVINTNSKYTAEEVKTCVKNLEDIIKAVNNFITSDKCYLRQLWAELCLQLLKDLPRNLFEENFLGGILTLTLDRVLNVRYSVSMIFVGWFPEYPAPWEDDIVENGESKSSPWEWFLKRTDVKKCVERLSKDDRDVFNNILQLQEVYADIEFRCVSCRGRKTAPGGELPIAIDGSPAQQGTPVPRASISELDNSFSRERQRSGSTSSFRARSSSLEQLTLEEANAHLRLPKIQAALQEDEDDSHTYHPIDLAAASRSRVDDGEPTFMINAHVAEELDIIDGIIKSPHHRESEEAAQPPNLDEALEEIEQEVQMVRRKSLEGNELLKGETSDN